MTTTNNTVPAGQSRLGLVTGVRRKPCRSLGREPALSGWPAIGSWIRKGTGVTDGQSVGRGPTARPSETTGKIQPERPKDVCSDTRVERCQGRCAPFVTRLVERAVIQESIQESHVFRACHVRHGDKHAQVRARVKWIRDHLQLSVVFVVPTRNRYHACSLPTPR